MARNRIIYDNLRAEMARKNIVICDMSKQIGMNRDTLSRKLAGKAPLYLDEVFRIQKMFFPDVDIMNLFNKSSAS